MLVRIRDANDHSKEILENVGFGIGDNSVVAYKTIPVEPSVLDVALSQGVNEGVNHGITQGVSEGVSDTQTVFEVMEQVNSPWGQIIDFFEMLVESFF